MIQFLLNQTLQSVHSLDPNTTVLEYLRTHLGKTGTKEGCASGDCGACTVVIAEVKDDQLHYRSINACLTFICALQGKQLITVEDLKQPTQLHAVQQAMADCHGSQCGYCTPGFVMSLFALQKNTDHYDKHRTTEALAGNLCRCTGYRPIYAAAQHACQNPSHDQFDQQQANTIQQLKQIQTANLAHFTHQDVTCFMPSNVTELAQCYQANPQARLLAGGTDLALEVTQMHRSIRQMIYLGQVQELAQIHQDDDFLYLGAAVTLSNAYPILAQHFADCGTLLSRFASLQIRNQGTLGGNIANASPIGDTPPMLIALGAQLQLRCGESVRVLPLEDFFIDYKKTQLAPGEFIETVRIPKAGAEHFKIYKISKRLDDDISAVCAAFTIQLDNGVITQARLAFGGMAAIPKRAHVVENRLVGQPFCQASFDMAAQQLHQDFTPLTDFRASQAYRLLVAQNCLRKYYLEVEAQLSGHNQDYHMTRVTAYV